MELPSDEVFEKLIARALDELPEKYVSKLNNVAITYADEPSAEQRQKLKLRAHHSLFGLYEGIPLTARGNNYSFVLPDKITLFKLPLFYAYGRNQAEFFKQIKHTLWHEIAHYFGLDHDRIDYLEKQAN